MKIKQITIRLYIDKHAYENNGFGAVEDLKNIKNLELSFNFIVL